MRMIEGDFEAEARRVFENIKAVIAAAGGTFAQVVKVTIFITDFANFVKLNELNGAISQGTLSGALDSCGGGAAAQRARRDRVHAAPGVDPHRWPGCTLHMS